MAFFAESSVTRWCSEAGTNVALLLPGECEQGHEFPLAALDLFGHHDGNGTAVDRVHDGDGLEVSGGDQTTLRVVSSESVIVGAAHQGADFCDVDQDNQRPRRSDEA